MPSMPLQPEGAASDPYIELPKGVMGAVDKLVEMGIADPDRLAVMGQSFYDWLDRYVKGEPIT